MNEEQATQELIKSQENLKIVKEKQRQKWYVVLGLAFLALTVLWYSQNIDFNKFIIGVAVACILAVIIFGKDYIKQLVYKPIDLAEEIPKLKDYLYKVGLPDCDFCSWVEGLPEGDTPMIMLYRFKQWDYAKGTGYSRNILVKQSVLTRKIIEIIPDTHFIHSLSPKLPTAVPKFGQFFKPAKQPIIHYVGEEGVFEGEENDENGLE